MKRTANALARALGWFSIGLGLVEAVAPRRIGRLAGMRASDTLLRIYGAREIVTGIGLLTARDVSPWMWTRVAADALDAATVRTATGDPLRAGISLGLLAAVSAADVAVAVALSRPQREAPSHDYSGRSGLPQAPEAMRGAARADFEVPGDMQVPSALRPYTLH